MLLVLYSNFFLLCKFLGFENEEDVVGKLWSDFLNESDKSVLAYIQEKMKALEDMD